MTSALQMSSRKPPVRQSTFGFPDDSAHHLVGTTSTSSHLSTTTPPPAAPASTQPATFNPKPETRPQPSPCPRCLSWSNLATPKNVEKLSFQARLNCLYRQSKKIFTASKVNIFPRPTPPIRRPAQPSTFNRQLETNSFPASCLRELCGRQSGSRKNVERFSFQARVRAISCETEKIFWPLVSTFSPVKTVQLSCLLCVSVSFVGGPFSIPSLCPPLLCGEPSSLRDGCPKIVDVLIHPGLASADKEGVGVP